MNNNSWDIQRVRADFPILASQVNGHPLVYLDSAATAQKPTVLIEATKKFLESSYASVHRGNHQLTEQATELFEQARARVAAFVNAADPCEIIFTKGTTESINLLAHSIGATLSAGDEIIISELEHHANIVPWQMLAERTGVKLKIIPVIKETGVLNQQAFEKLLSEKTKLVSLAHISNVLGTINPLAQIIERAHAYNSLVHIDGAQGIVHSPVDLAKLNCDFYSFSAHKLYGPTGVGVLWGKQSVLESLPPYQGGGNMIHQVSFEGTTYNDLPHKFEAGTPHISGVITFPAVLDYLESLGQANIHRHLHSLTEYFKQQLAEFAEVTLLANTEHQAGVFAFCLKDIHAQDVGVLLNEKGIAIRVGHHCTQPLHQKYGLRASARASLALYNNTQDIDRFFEGLRYVQSMF